MIFNFNAEITVYFESADLRGGVLEVGAAGELAADVVLGAGGLLGPGLGGAGAGEGVGAGAEVAGPRAGVAHLPLGVKPQLVVTRYHHLVLVRQLKHWCLVYWIKDTSLSYNRDVHKITKVEILKL